MSRVVEQDRRVRWSQVEDDFYVGNHLGNFVGYIDRAPDGTFNTFDRMSVPRGRAETLEQSMASLDELYFAEAEAEADAGDGGRS
jgi:hypothetical protein